MFVNLKIKNFFLFFIFSLINSKFNDFYDLSEETHYYSLPNEFPTIINNHELDSVIFNNLNNKIGKIFGYLPFTEQIKLLKNDYVNSDNSSKIFKETDSIIDSLKSSWEKEAESISYYIEKNEKMLLSGLGCIKTVLQKYGYKTEFNKDLYNDAYKKINNILQAQRTFIDRTTDFLKDIHQIIFAHRLDFLANISYDNASNTDNYFSQNNIYNKNEKEIILKKYSKNDKTSIVNYFRNYLKFKEEYDIILNKNAMKIIMDISRMDGCKNYDDPDYNAGKSSDTVSSPEITYRHKKIVGINDISGIRNDKKTMNGYELNYGYHLGTSENENYKPFPFDFANLILYFNNTIKNDSDNDKNFKRILNDIYNLEIDSVDFYPNLMDLISESNVSDYLKINDSTKKLSNSDIKLKTDYNSGDFEMYYYKKSNDEYIYYINKTDSKSYYDLVINGKSLGDDLLVIQSCFGVFTSGGKHDKNACRDVLTKDCGINLDYKCKKAGFYDYINANPAVIDKSIYEKTDDNELFEFFYRHFLLGGIAIRPSAFTGINLILQSYKKGTNLYKEIYDNKDISFFDNSIEDKSKNYDILFSIFDNSKNNMEKFQNNEIDKSNYNLISKTNYFSFKLKRIFFTFLFLYLI